MTAYDPSLAVPRPGLLERLGFRPHREIEDAAPLEAEPPRLRVERGGMLDRIGQFLESHKLEPSPFTLATAYEFVSGDNERLRREVDARVSKLEPITTAWLKSIADSGVEDPNDQFDTIFDLLETNISQFSDTTQTAQRATREYGAVLAGHAAELKKADDGQRQLVQVATVVAAMVQRTKKLEDQLIDSQKQARMLKKNLDDVQQRANQDHLTGLPNRRAFDRLFDEQVIAAQAEIEPLCIAFCDVDHFKLVNDTHGHEAGDRVLKAIARRLVSASDDCCHVARHGGTVEGTRIDLVDNADFSMFTLGTTVLTPEARTLLRAIVETVAPEGAGLTIRGHTDALKWRGGGGNNWALSAGRAEATRQAMIRQGIVPARFQRIEGVADRELLVKDNPGDPRNRRISITVIH